jgi:uncharacterized membrane protein YfcA
MLILIGLIVGSILGIFGAGGTILAVPFLIFGLNMDPKEAIPISMFAVAVSATYGSVDSLLKKKVRYRAATLIALFAMLISPFGISLGQLLPKDPLMILFSIILFWVGYKALMKNKDTNSRTSINDIEESFPCEINEETNRIRWNNKCARSLSLTGGLTGFLSGLLGVGGGFIIVPALKKFSNISLDNIIPTSTAVIAIIATYNSSIFIYKGLLNIHDGVLFCIGTTTGMFLAKKITIEIKSLDKAFSYFLILISLLLVMKTIFF